jgi:DNA-binding CsgD family transcriptional regulator
MYPQTGPSPETRDPLRVTAALAQALFDQVGSGLIACDAEGFMRAVNRTARAELQRGRLIRACGLQLQRAPTAQGELAAAIRQAACKGRRSMVRLTAGEERLHLNTLPVLDGGEALTLVVLGRRQACSELELELLASSYGLTQAERRVLAGLMQEERPSEIAERHAVKLSTVRTQISSIRAKLGTRSVEGLLLRAAEVPAMPSALGLAA